MLAGFFPKQEASPMVERVRREVERAAHKVERVATALDLLFHDGSEWKPLPSWAEFYISLGASMSAARVGAPKRIVAILSVPTPSFAAAFISLGRVLSEGIEEPSRDAIEVHFERLKSLPINTPLIYFDGEALYAGPFLGVFKYYDDELIRIAIRKGTCMVPKRRSLLVEMPPANGIQGTLRDGARLRNPKPFVSKFFSLAEHYRILCNTTRSVIVVGEKNRLRDELVSTPFALRNGAGDLVEGALQDLIRVGKFSSGGIGCRADVHPRSRSHAIPNGTAPGRPLVVLDGAISYFRHAGGYAHHDTITILSRTDSEYDTAVDTANGRYLTRLGDYSLPGLFPQPAGIDLMLHLENR